MMELETERLVLREWARKDARDLIDGLGDIRVSKWLAYVNHPYTRKDANGWIDYCAKLSKEGPKRAAYHFAIELKSEKKVIGGISLSGINWAQGIAEGGFWLNSRYHRKGYGTEAVAARLEFAFNRLKLRRIENGFFKGNTASYRLQMKFGYRVEGLMRKRYLCMADGKAKDEYITALLREDWLRKRSGTQSSRHART